jgi:hypothetical protein
VSSALVAIGEALDPAEVEPRLRTALAGAHGQVEDRVVAAARDDARDRGRSRGRSGLERLEGYVRLHS